MGPVTDRVVRNPIRTGLSDLLKPLNAEVGVTAREDSYPTYFVMFFGIVMLFLFYFVLLLINNQSVLLPPRMSLTSTSPISFLTSSSVRAPGKHWALGTFN